MLLEQRLSVALVALLGILGTAAGESPEECRGLDPGPTRTVTRILDGETVVLDDATQLRLIGALAPRAVDADAEPGAWPVAAAATEALRGLVLGKSIELRFASERTDRYGRLQAQVYLLEGEQLRWVQGYLVREGLARAYTLAGNRACATELLAAEHAAREARRGLWAETAYQIRQSDKFSELLRYRATFQVVEGTIVRVAEVRGTIYLNFDRNWRRGFSVSLRRDDRHLLGEHASNAKGLEGRRVRVRGWIEQGGSAPIINLSSGGLIEMIADVPAPQPH